MIFSDGVRVLVQPRLAILSSVVWQMREIEKSRLLELVMFLEIGGIHDGWRDLRTGTGFAQHNVFSRGLRSSKVSLSTLPLSRCHVVHAQGWMAEKGTGSVTEGAIGLNKNKNR